MAAFFVLALLLSYSSAVLANPACPVCTVAVVASLEIARYLGVDDSVVGVWSGAFLTIFGYWMIVWFDKKGWHFYGRNFILMFLSVGMIGFMYYYGRLEYTPEPILIFFIDPFLFSVLLGGGVLALSNKLYEWLKSKNGGHAHFPFEKVALPVLALVALSIYFYYQPLCNSVLDMY